MIRETVLRGVPIDAVHMHHSGRRVLVHARDNIVRMLDLRTNLWMQKCVHARMHACTEIPEFMLKSHTPTSTSPTIYIVSDAATGRVFKSVWFF